MLSSLKPRAKPFLVATWLPSSPFKCDGCLLQKLKSQGLEINILGDLVSPFFTITPPGCLKHVTDILQYEHWIDTVAKSTSTTIDRFLTNDSTKLSHREAIEIGIRDHKLIFAIGKRPSVKTNPTVIESRQIRSFDRKHLDKISCWSPGKL